MKDNYLIQVPDIHIGNEILSCLKNKGITLAKLARTIRMDPANLGRSLKRKSIETLTLIKISQAIGHNFFLLWIEDTTPEQFSSTIAEEPNKAIGNSVKIRMNELNITQKVFAARLGITQPGINRLINKTSVNTDYLAHISRLLGKNFFKEFCFDKKQIQTDKEEAASTGLLISRFEKLVLENSRLKQELTDARMEIARLRCMV